MINIPVPPLDPIEEGPREVDAKFASHAPYLEHMSNALASERGIRLKTGSKNEAEQLRFRCYRARKYVVASGVTSFNGLTFLVEGSDVLIKKDTPIEVEAL